LAFLPSANPEFDAQRRRSPQRSFVFVVAVQRVAVLDVGMSLVGDDWLVLVLMMMVVAVVPVSSLRLVAAGEQHCAKASRTAFGVGVRVVHASSTRFFVGAIRNKYVRRKFVCMALVLCGFCL
jgi:hypothetical protein